MALTNITGYIYSPQGTPLTTGILHFTLQQDMVVAGEKVAPYRISFNLATGSPTGHVNINLYPTTTALPAGLSYFVEFDPDPTDVSKPIYAKVGYFSNYFIVGESATSLGDFLPALRGSSATTYLAVNSPAKSAYERLTIATTNITLNSYDVGQNVVINSTTARTVNLLTPAVYGVSVTVSLNTAAASNTHNVNPGTGVTIKGNGLSKAAGANLLCSSNQAGDFVHLVALDSTNWYITMSRGTWD